MIEIRTKQDNFNGYWLVIKYRIIIVMFTIDENRVSEVVIQLDLHLVPQMDIHLCWGLMTWMDFQLGHC